MSLTILLRIDVTVNTQTRTRSSSVPPSARTCSSRTKHPANKKTVATSHGTSSWGQRCALSHLLIFLTIEIYDCDKTSSRSRVVDFQTSQRSLTSWPAGTMASSAAGQVSDFPWLRLAHKMSEQCSHAVNAEVCQKQKRVSLVCRKKLSASHLLPLSFTLSPMSPHLSPLKNVSRISAPFSSFRHPLPLPRTLPHQKLEKKIKTFISKKKKPS